MRTFVAVEVHSKDVLDAIANLQTDFDIKASPVSRQNMHFTLLFLGEVTDDTAEDVKKSLSSIVFRPIELSFTHLGAFPNPKFPRVIWIGVDKVASEQLVGLAAQVEKKLAPLGFKSDKPFKPHLTIFRVKNKIDDISKKIEKHMQVSLGKDVICELKFKKSVLTSNGPIYSDLQVIKVQ
ncbi:MAG: RNA 2',3'-cyclic phosphodiesterase [Nitrosotalea sp.]